MAIPQACEDSRLALAMQQQLDSSMAREVALSQELDTVKALGQHAESPTGNCGSLGDDDLHTNGNGHISTITRAYIKVTKQ
ncbi:hypothetical protein FQN50_004612 [Emmonsiellopsis sp. PD_5]|nr:hypothetical protein FQN50_004612 [Emmonsiellopsis sp. PD_5]